MSEVRDAEVMTVGPDEVVVTFTSAPDQAVTTRIGDSEITTVGPFHTATVKGLTPGTAYDLAIDAGLVDTDERYLPPTVTTLKQPTGALLTTFATVNDVHFGEIECGRLEFKGQDITGDVFVSGPGDDPYPEVMNGGAISDIDALNPDAVIAKGDLTSLGTDEEYDAFLTAYGHFGDRLYHVRGNHDAALSDTLATTAPFAVELPGATLAVLDTVRYQRENGRITDGQFAWLDQLAEEADRPVFVFGHHHAWAPDSNTRSDDYFGINPDDSETLVDIVHRRESIAGYFAGHTHRNRVRRFAEARDVPFVEVACVKDYPGSWAEYRVYEDGYVQLHRRITPPAARAWTEVTRRMFHGLYRDYALGQLEWRCFTQPF